MVTVLVTGGAGFIGSHIVKALLDRGDQVIVYDNYAQANPRNLEGVSGEIEVVAGDILDLPYLMNTVKKFGVEKIIHMAAIVGGMVSVEKPTQTAKVNIEGTLNALETARIMGAQRVIGFSTESVYGPFRYEPADEDHPRNPQTPYAITKMVCEMLGLHYHRFYGVDFIAVRPSYVYGPAMPGEGRRARPPKTFVVSAVEGKPLKMEEGGDQKVDQVHVKDLVQGVLLTLDAKEPKHRIYNLASGKAYTFGQTAEIVKELVPGASIEVGPGLLTYSMGQEGAIDLSRAREDLGYTPKYDLRDGLKDYIEWYRKNRY